MISVVIATQDSERALVPTLSALVAGAVAGIVREVIIADGCSRDGTAIIAEGAGCGFIASAAGRGARLEAAAETARAPWLLFLVPGTVPDPAWIDEAQRFVEENGAAGSERAAVFRPVAGSRPLLVEAFALARAALGGRPRPGQGLLIAKAHYAALGAHRDVEEPEAELLRRLGRRRIVMLRAGARLAPGT
jgi:glycosyltransferase involved in cell wall biosynthesis